MARHANRTLSGDRKIREIQETYEKWWKGKIIKTSRVDNPIQKVIDVKYYGNSVYGGVTFTLEDGSEYFPFFRGYRPKKSDVEIVESAG